MKRKENVTKNKPTQGSDEEDEDSIPIMSTQEMTEYLLLQKKKRGKVMRRVARRCCKCWSVLIAVLIALTSILLGALLSVLPEYKTYHFTPITPPTKVLLFGASGATGQVIVDELLNSDSIQSVTSLGRRKVLFRTSSPEASTEKGYTTHPKLQQQIVDFDNLKKSKHLFEGYDAVFWALGTTRSKAGSHEAFKKVDYGYLESAAKLCKDSGISHFLLVSSIGADANSSLLYPATKGQIEEYLKTLKFDRLSIFRPSLLLTPREERRSGEALAQVISPYLSWTLGGSLRKYKEIPVETVGKAMMLVLYNTVVDPKAQGTLGENPIVETFESDNIYDLVSSKK